MMLLQIAAEALLRLAVEEAPTRSSVSLHSLEAWHFRDPAELLTIIAAKVE
jgi:hypothetical protein